MAFASINSTNPRTNPRIFHQTILRIGDFGKCTFFESAISKFFFKKKFFCLILDLRKTCFFTSFLQKSDGFSHFYQRFSFFPTTVDQSEYTNRTGMIFLVFWDLGQPFRLKIGGFRDVFNFKNIFDSITMSFRTLHAVIWQFFWLFFCKVPLCCSTLNCHLVT